MNRISLNLTLILMSLTSVHAYSQLKRDDVLKIELSRFGTHCKPTLFGPEYYFEVQDEEGKRLWVSDTIEIKKSDVGKYKALPRDGFTGQIPISVLIDKMRDEKIKRLEEDLEGAKSELASVKRKIELHEKSYEGYIKDTKYRERAAELKDMKWNAARLVKVAIKALDDGIRELQENPRLDQGSFVLMVRSDKNQAWQLVKQSVSYALNTRYDINLNDPWLAKKKLPASSLSTGSEIVGDLKSASHIKSGAATFEVPVCADFKYKVTVEKDPRLTEQIAQQQVRPRRHVDKATPGTR